MMFSESRGDVLSHRAARLNHFSEHVFLDYGGTIYRNYIPNMQALATRLNQDGVRVAICLCTCLHSTLLSGAQSDYNL